MANVLRCKKRKRSIVKAYVHGGPVAPEINGVVYFFPYKDGSLVYAKLKGLPPYMPAQNGESPIGPHGFHIHEFGICAIGDPADPFLAAGGHWNPTNQPHGNHAGDFPVVFSNNGKAKMKFYTNRFRPSEVVDRSVMIHINPDDYRTQPSGNSGKRAACGVIKRYRK